MFCFDGINKVLSKEDTHHSIRHCATNYRLTRRFWLAKMLTYSGDWSDRCFFGHFLSIYQNSISVKYELSCSAWERMQ